MKSSPVMSCLRVLLLIGLSWPALRVKRGVELRLDLLRHRLQGVLRALLSTDRELLRLDHGVHVLPGDRDWWPDVDVVGIATLEQVLLIRRHAVEGNLVVGPEPF